MHEFKTMWSEVKWYCPNCGSLLVACRNKNGTAKRCCEVCHSTSIHQVVGRRHKRIDVYAPREQAEASL